MSTHASIRMALICIFSILRTPLPAPHGVAGAHLAWVPWHGHRRGCLPEAKLTVVSCPWGVLCLFQSPRGLGDCERLGGAPLILQSCRHGVGRAVAHNAGPWRNLAVAGVRQVVRFSWRCKCVTWMREGKWSNSETRNQGAGVAGELACPRLLAPSQFNRKVKKQRSRSPALQQH